MTSAQKNSTIATSYDAKGDLLAGTGADAFAKLTVGTNGLTLVADSAASTGLKWGTPTFVGAYAYMSANQTLSNNTNTILTFGAEDFDTNSFHSTSSNTSRMTIPTGYAGKYLICANVTFNTNGTGQRAMNIKKNGNVIAYSVLVQATATTYGTALNISKIENCAVGDYIEIEAYQNSGGSLDILGGSALQAQFQIGFLGA